MRNEHGIVPCRRYNCCLCSDSAEASTVHSDCLEIVARGCKLHQSLDRLWIITAWRVPWLQAPSFHLDEAAITPDFSVLDRLGFPEMRSLPQELIRTVHKHSRGNLFWRSSAARELIPRISSASSKEVLSIPLCTISAWDRGGQPFTEETVHELPVIRLTIDTWGIKRVERLPKHPCFQKWRTDQFRYVVLDQSNLERVVAHFKVSGRLPAILITREDI